MFNMMATQNHLLPLLFLVLVTVSYGYIVEPGPKIKATKGEVWPKAHSEHKYLNYYSISSSFKFTAIGQDCDILQNGFRRYEIIITDLVKDQYETDLSGRDNGYYVGVLTELNVLLREPCQSIGLPTENMNETYRLDLSPSDPTQNLIEASSVWGALRGLETFSQLFYRSQTGQVVANATQIIDFPRFFHRGLLLDTSRHYLPVDKILATLDAMAYNKLNVFHWHIVDDQSFPYQSVKFPELSEKGAYHPVTKIYTPQDVQQIINYAGQRGIRVMAEFDTPGHTRSWGEGVEGILTPCYKNGLKTGQFGPLDPSKDFTYSFLGEFLEEVVETFPDQYFHLGGDEVGYECWQSNPDINQFMERNNLTQYSKLEDYYVKKIVDIVHNLKVKSVVWEEVFVNGVEIPKTTVVHVWRGSHWITMNKATKAGYPVLLSSCWYLDHLATGGDWEKFYACEPLAFNGTKEQEALVLGGEACMWGETVDETNVISRVWPRASAVAEKLWSLSDADSIDGAAHRLEEHTCRMNKRGIGAQPPNGPGVCL